MPNLPRAVVPNALKLPSTLSTVQIYGTIRQALLDYLSPQRETLRVLFDAEPRIYVRAQPEPAVFPYLTLLLNRTSQASYNGYRETALLEVQALGKPESQLPLVESIMDLVDQCLTAYTAPESGLIVARSRTRATVPLFTTPAESQTVGVVSTYTLYLWPAVLTSRA
jgi:hypothetical protein